MGHTSEKKFPVNAKDYKLYEEVGEGVSATVYRALCIPLNEIVAIKVLDLEKCNNDLDGIRREVQTMSLIDHPNLLRAHCSFTAGHSLWVVMPYMSGGSCLHIMKSAYPEGFEEPVIATLLREVLKALVYLHYHGHIHRDVKAGNILIDFNGAIKLADFGVSACMFDTGDRQRSRNTFVGTPCWMAPEVMQQLHGYDFKADIWSFGITALELAHGHAPFSKYPPMKVLLMTLQNAPPGLDYERDKRFSKSFKELVAACLAKDPKKRPTSEKLLKHQFFKHARSNEYLARAILDGLSPLGDRFKMLKAKEADLLVQNKAMHGDKEQLSQQEYMRGISAWNFNLEDLKTQAALIQDDDDISNTEPNPSSKQDDGYDDKGFAPERLFPERVNNLDAAALEEDELNELDNVEDSLASFPIRPLQALRGCFDVEEDAVQLESKHPFPVPSQRTTDSDLGKRDNLGRTCSLPKFVSSGDHKKFLSGSLLPENVFSPSRKVNGIDDREYLKPKYQSERNYSGTLLNRPKRDSYNHSSAEDASEGPVVQRGRFKVTSSDLSPKGALANSPGGCSAAQTSQALTTASVLQSLQFILQQNTSQREQIVKLIKFVGLSPEFSDIGKNDLSQISLVSPREKELQVQVVCLQQSIGSLVEELQRLKMQNAQLERQLNIIIEQRRR